MEDRSPRPLPPYRDPRAGLVDALHALRPAARISVTAAAEKSMRVRVAGQWQTFDRSVTPYMVEPTDMIISREYRGLTFCGPSQSGKTQMLQSAVSYNIAYNPGRTALFQMTKDAASEYSQEKLGPMIRHSPELLAKQSAGRGADNIFEKKFKGGMRLTIDWPSITKFSSSTIRTVLQTDYDHFPESIDGEGDGYTLGRARAKTHGSRGMCAIESSPAKPIIKEDWKPKTIHEAPPVSAGVLSHYNDGTRARLYWECPECAERFEPKFNQLHYDRDLQPAEAAETVVLVCPNNGCVIEASKKYQMNAGSIWLHESRDGTRAVPLGDPDIRPGDMVSYWMTGVAAAFESWANLVLQYETARRSFVTTNNEDKLKSVTNTALGEPYLPRAMAEDGDLTVDHLKKNLRSWPRGVAPEWTRFITIGVDVQDNRFPVGVFAWGEEGECAMIDRLELFTPPAAAPGAGNRMLMPPKYIEDWEVLRDLLTRVWPVAGQEYGLQALSIGYDFHGSAGVSDRAELFWQARRDDGEQSRWFAIRGHGGFKTGGRVWYAAPVAGSKGKKARQMMLLNVATDKMKDITNSALSRVEGGAGALHLSRWMVDDESLAEVDLLKEFTAERRTARGWEKKTGIPRNENIDLAGYARAVAIHQGAEKINLAAPPVWAILGPSNALAKPLTEKAEQAPNPLTEPVKKKAPRRIKYLEN